ncbi:hypothetical protein G3573_18495, partial [Caulobacter sp. 17J65-9]|nr:hypothetical protein [Caulobacter sp. 17J65-9]
MDAVANDAETPARADGPAAPKKGFLNSAKLAAANAAVTEASAEDAAAAPTAPTAPAAATAPTPDADEVDTGKDEATVASDETAPAADAAASDTAAPVVVPPAPTTQATAPSADGEAKGVDAADVSTVGRALGAIDRILNENGVPFGGQASPERLQAVKAAVDEVMAKAPPHVRAKLEALFARVLQPDADASASPATEEVAQADAEAAQAQAQAEAAQAAETLKAIQTALTGGQTRRPATASVMRDFAAANAAEASTPTPRLADPRQEAAREAPA